MYYKKTRFNHVECPIGEMKGKHSARRCSIKERLSSPHKRQRVPLSDTHGCCARRGRSCRGRFLRPSYIESAYALSALSIRVNRICGRTHVRIRISRLRDCRARARRDVGIPGGKETEKRAATHMAKSRATEREPSGRKEGKENSQQVPPSLLRPVAKGQYTGCRLHGNRSSGRNSLCQINSRFARVDRAEIYAKPGDPSRIILRDHCSPLPPPLALISDSRSPSTRTSPRTDWLFFIHAFIDLRVVQLQLDI